MKKASHLKQNVSLKLNIKMKNYSIKFLYYYATLMGSVMYLCFCRKNTYRIKIFKVIKQNSKKLIQIWKKLL